MNKRILLGLYVIGLTLLIGCTEKPIVTDPEIEEVSIGGQIWTAFNVDSGYGVSYLQKPDNAEIYGRLLTYDEAVAACPEGWRLPSMADWQTLFDFLGGIDVAGGKLKGTDYWMAPNIGDVGTSGFNALPAGGASDKLQFDGIDWSAHFWSSTSEGTLQLVPSLFNDSASVDVIRIPKTMYASVRYIKE